jgi:hypothetical protein
MIPITPFMLLILAGYALFIGALGTTCLRLALAKKR